MLVLRHIDFTVYPGEVVAVLGSNGAGKSTLAQSISGIMRPDGGTIDWLGTTITALPAFRRARLGIAHCQEGRKLFPGMTVRKNLELGAYGRTRAEIAERVDEVFTIFPPLAQRDTQIATTMSGGQQQMLAIGRALMSRPKLLLCDEVTLGLSPKVADEIYESLTAVVGGGASIVLIEQDAARCLSVATRAYVLSHGTLAYSGPANDLTEEMLVSAYLGDSTTTPTTTDR